jgi:hypothetical protein
MISLVRIGSCETWVPLGPHQPGSWPYPTSGSGCPRQVGPAYQKTRRPASGPNRPSWGPTRPLEDLEDPPDDLIHHDLKTWRTRQRPRWISPEADLRDMARCVT